MTLGREASLEVHSQPFTQWTGVDVALDGISLEAHPFFMSPHEQVAFRDDLEGEQRRDFVQYDQIDVIDMRKPDELG